MDLMIDKLRWERKESILSDSGTGISVRAQMPFGKLPGKWESVDIVLLDKESLLKWLRSKGGKNEWAENVVAILLGHGHIV